MNHPWFYIVKPIFSTAYKEVEKEQAREIIQLSCFVMQSNDIHITVSLQVAKSISRNIKNNQQHSLNDKAADILFGIESVILSALLTY